MVIGVFVFGWLFALIVVLEARTLLRAYRLADADDPELLRRIAKTYTVAWFLTAVSGSRPPSTCSNESGDLAGMTSRGPRSHGDDRRLLVCARLAFLALSGILAVAIPLD